MPIVIIQHGQQRACGMLDQSALIGRSSRNALTIDHADVSRRHACIRRLHDGYWISDLKSRTGTRLNGMAITEGTRLSDGDVIGVGPATIEFRQSSGLPSDLSSIPLIAQGRFIKRDGDHVHFSCSCGKTVIVAMEGDPKLCRCKGCAQIVRVPEEPSVPELCSICQSPMLNLERTIRCPECALGFHADCWKENFGCSAYGCGQVNVLAPQHPPPKVDDQSPEEPRWGLILLTSSVVGSLVGSLTFGVPALAAGVGSMLYLARHREQRKSAAVITSAALALLGVGVGLVVSWMWWFDQPILQWSRR